ncbi:MAG: ADP-forming succinate--CoA ligase subunit beta [Candidatus Bathyarchaeia archaeon]
MKLYEHETKAIFQTYGVPTPRGAVAATPQQACQVAAKLGAPVAVKAQVLVGGRGKAGGILFADTAEEAENAAEKLLSMQVKGAPVSQVLVEEKVAIEKELYFGITVDRLNRCYVAAASQSGGIDVEDAAAQSPQTIHKTLIDPKLGFRPFHARQTARELGYSGTQLTTLSTILEQLYHVGMDFDAEIIEVNPLAETTDGRFMAVDARLNVDDNALFRHPELQAKRLAEPRDLTPREAEALRKGLDYVKLDGDVGIVGNGAGLVMATLDVVAFYGGKPADFLDLGGGASTQRIVDALELVLPDPEAKVLFVNIMGGMTRCDEVAQAIVTARRETTSPKNIAIRLVGTNEEEGKRILAAEGLRVFDNMEEAAREAVRLAKEAR